MAVAGLSASAVSAGTMGSVDTDHWVVALSAGPAWSNAGETQTFFIDPEIEKTFAADRKYRPLAEGELFLGMQRQVRDQWLGQLGLAVALAGNVRASGEVWDDADPLFNNHSYAYRVNQTRLALKGKLLADRGYFVTPWISGSLGIGFNNAHAYENTPLIYEALSTPNFASHIKAGFTYTAGAGVQKNLDEHVQVGIGYEFADWGKSNLGPAPGQSVNSGLALNHLYTHGVLLNVTYVV